MSLDISLHTAMSGLRIAQRSLATTAQNIANVDTPGYSRKISTQQSLAPGGVGAGVLAGTVRRLYDQSLQTELHRRTGDLAALQVRNSYLRRIEEVQGAPDAGINISARLTAVRDAFVQLGTTPDDSILQTNALMAADDFARTMNDVSRTILATRNAAQNELTEGLANINSLLKRIEQLDAQITLDIQRAGGATDLEDKRDAAVAELSELVGIRTLRRSDGSLLISTTNGLTLFDRVPQTLEFQGAQLDHTSYYRASPPGTVTPITIGSGAEKRDVTSTLTGGRIGGLLSLRDTELPRMQAELDELAYQMAARFQANGMTLYTKADGITVPGNLPSAHTGFAAEIRVAQAMIDDPRLIALGDAGLSILPAPSGSVQDPPFPLALGSAQVQRIINQVFESSTGSSVTPHRAFATGGLGPDPMANLTTTLPAMAKLTDYAAQLVAKHSGERGRVGAEEEQAGGVLQSLQERYQDATGVNLDDEMAYLQILQRSYAASAQVLRSIDRMTNDLFNAA
ncbi:flagellar hook-associated protein FlgK [Indioceanicola profundi]|uniref:flagellar hook-associated protein FlgK n=1 Tax=Indioceanicola profundi TaxID=2220096 RepID=UPI000E6AC3C0|nr:flagellar hook-associated protein FlgK [Indioceanicola profundi]